MMVLSFIGFGIIGWLAFTRPDWLLACGVFTAIPGYFLILLCFTPLGGIRLGAPEERLPWSAWLGGIAKAHVVLIVFTLAVLLGFFGGGPAFTQKMHFASAIFTIKDYTTWQWGIFPWGVFGLWGLTIAYVAYVKQAPPYLYAVVQGLLPKRLEPMVKTFIEAAQFSATALGVTLVVSAIVLLLSYAVESFVHTSHLIMAPITVSFLSVFVVIISLKSTRQKVRYWRGRVTLNNIIAMCIIGLIGLLVMSALTTQWILARHPELLNQIVCKQCEHYFGGISPEVRFAALYWGWWLTWVPLGGSYLAKLSKGRTLRQFVMGLFAFPFLLWIALLGLSKVSPTQSQLTLAGPYIFVLLIALPFVAWWMLARMLKHTESSGFFLSGYMPVSAHFKRNRLWLCDASKTVGLSKYGPKVIILIFSTLFLHTTAGWYGIQIQLAAMGVVIINAVYAAFDFLVVQLIKDTFWSKK